MILYPVLNDCQTLCFGVPGSGGSAANQQERQVCPAHVGASSLSRVKTGAWVYQWGVLGLSWGLSAASGPPLLILSNELPVGVGHLRMT